MRPILRVVIVVVAMCGSFVYADQNNSELDMLFSRLHETVDEDEAAEITRKIWRNWYENSDAAVNELMYRGEISMRHGKYDDAVNYFSEIIDIAPDFAEGWNRRATAYYIIGEYQLSTDDVAKTLNLEPRHFGALSGQGMIYLQLEQRDLALQYMERALEANPHMQAVRSSIKALRKLIDGEVI